MTEKHHQPVPLFRNASALSRALSTIAILLLGIFPLSAADLRLNEQDYFEAQGLSILLLHNAFHGVFGDEKMSGVEIILRGERIATNGDVRPSSLSYPDRGLSYHIEVAPEPDGFRVTEHLDHNHSAGLSRTQGCLAFLVVRKRVCGRYRRFLYSCRKRSKRGGQVKSGS